MRPCFGPSRVAACRLLRIRLQDMHTADTAVDQFTLAALRTYPFYQISRITVCTPLSLVSKHTHAHVLRTTLAGAHYLCAGTMSQRCWVSEPGACTLSSHTGKTENIRRFMLIVHISYCMLLLHNTTNPRCTAAAPATAMLKNAMSWRAASACAAASTTQPARRATNACLCSMTKPGPWGWLANQTRLVPAPHVHLLPTASATGTPIAARTTKPAKVSAKDAARTPRVPRAKHASQHSNSGSLPAWTLIRACPAVWTADASQLASLRVPSATPQLVTAAAKMVWSVPRAIAAKVASLG